MALPFASWSSPSIESNRNEEKRRERLLPPSDSSDYSFFCHTPIDWLIFIDWLDNTRCRASSRPDQVESLLMKFLFIDQPGNVFERKWNNTKISENGRFSFFPSEWHGEFLRSSTTDCIAAESSTSEVHIGQFAIIRKGEEITNWLITNSYKITKEEERRHQRLFFPRFDLPFNNSVAS